MGRALVGAGALLGFLGVAAGAFGAHAIRERVSVERLDSWKTAADYQLWHALATIASGLIAVRWASGAAAAAGERKRDAVGETNPCQIQRRCPNVF